MLAVKEKISAKEIERAIAERSFERFLDYVWIKEPTHPDGKVKFEKWAHLQEVNETLLGGCSLFIWGKSRQIGATWDLAALDLWDAMYGKSATLPIFSKGQTEAFELISKIKFIYENLPPHLQEPFGKYSTSEITFPGSKGHILALPATEHAGRSFTAKRVIMDEADFHEYLDASYAAVKPTIDAGGQLILVSTFNPDSVVSTFKTLFRGAPENGFVKRYDSWLVRPNRTEEQRVNNIKTSPNPYKAEKEYAGSEEEALRAPKTLMAFDPDVLDLHKQDCFTPVRKLGLANIYVEFEPGERYGAFTDTSHGVGQDYAVTVVIQFGVLNKVVAEIISNVLPPDALALESIKLLAEYHNPIWGIEDNDWGRATIQRAQDMGYQYLYHRENDSDKPVGWKTDSNTRWLLWNEVIEAINSRNLRIPSLEGLKQFYDVIRNPEKQGRIEASEGAHDDYPLAVGGAWQLRKYARRVGSAVGAGPVKAPIMWQGYQR